MVRLALVLALAGCAVPPPPVAPVVANTPDPAPEFADDCNRDVPDCAAACAIRATRRTEHLEWFDRRCAAVVLGKNPDKAVGPAPPPKASDEVPKLDDLANPYR